MNESAIGYVAMAIVGLLASGVATLVTRLLGTSAERKLAADDETRTRAIRLEERLASRKAGHVDEEHELVLAITRLTQTLGELSTQVVRVHQETAKATADVSVQLAAMAVKIDQGREHMLHRLSAVEAAQREMQSKMLTDRDIVRLDEAGRTSTRPPSSRPPVGGARGGSQGG